MAQADRRKIETALEAKGFTKRDGDHEFYDLLVKGKKVGIMTKISRGSSYKVYSDSLLGMMAKQLRLRTPRKVLRIGVSDMIDAILPRKGAKKPTDIHVYLYSCLFPLVVDQTKLRGVPFC